MKKLPCTILLLFSCMLLSAQVDVRHAVDSLFQLVPSRKGIEKLELYDEIYQIMAYSVEPEEELRFLQEFLAEAQKQKALNYELTMRAAILNFYFNYEWTEEFMKVFPEHARYLDEHGQSELMIAMWSSKMRLYHYASRYDEAMREAEAMREEMNKRDDPYLLGAVIAATGLLYHFQEHEEQAIALMIEGVDLMAKKMPYDPLTILDTYKYLIDALIAKGRAEEALHYNKRYEAIIDQTEREVLEEYGDVENNFRVIIGRFYTNIQYANAYLAKGEFDQAETHIALAEKYVPEAFDNMRVILFDAKSDLYYKRGDYDQALDYMGRIIEMIEANNMLTEATRPKWYRRHGEYLAKAGRYEQAVAQYDTAFVQLMASNQDVFDKRLAAVHTLYKVDRLEIEKQRNRNYFLFALGGCALLFCILLLIVRHQRRLRSKNRSLVRQIESQDALKKEMRRLRQQSLTPSKQETPHETDGDTASDTSLFAQLENYLQTTGLFTHPELDRQQLAAALGTNQTYLYNAVREATGMPLLEYINSLRLEMAKELLKNNPETTILQIATQCGFSNIRTFRRQFKDFYGIVPSEYRSGLQQEG